MSVVVVEELRKSYDGVKAVDGISFEVRPGEFFGLLGPNGAGKTTTTEILEGLVSPDAGQARILGWDLRTELPKIKQHIGVQLQATALFKRLTVREHLELFASFYERAARVDDVLHMVHLVDKAHAQVAHLSGGQRQRLAIGLGLVNQPDILFLDEPTTGLDPHVRAHVLDVVASLRARGTTIFMTTHYMEEAERLCDRIAVMDHGRIIEVGRPLDMIDRHFEHALIELRRGEMKASDLAALPSIVQVEDRSDALVLHTKRPAEAVDALWSRARTLGVDLGDLRIHRASLEDVFLKLTGRPLRD